MSLTKATNTVIQTNTVIGDRIESLTLENRHIIDGVIGIEKLAANANTGIASANIDIVQANLTSLIVDDTTLHNVRTFSGNVLVNADFTMGLHTSPFVKMDNVRRHVTVVGNVDVTTGWLSTAMEPSMANQVSNIDHANSVYLANDFITFTSLTANIKQAFVNTNTSVNTANVFFIGSPFTPTTSNNIFITIDGLNQSNVHWVFNSGNNTIQFKDATMVSDLEFYVRAWHSLV